MSRTRRVLVALLVASTVLFAVGVIAERSQADTHTEPASVQAQQNEPTEPQGAHEEGQEEPSAESEHTGGDAQTGEAHADENEAVLGVDVESTPLGVLAVIVGLGLAALVATHLGKLSGVLGAIALIVLAWAALDVREAVHQLDESRTGIAILAIMVAALHVAAALLAGRMAAQARHADIGTPDHRGTMPA